MDSLSLFATKSIERDWIELGRNFRFVIRAPVLLRIPLVPVSRPSIGFGGVGQGGRRFRRTEILTT